MFRAKEYIQNANLIQKVFLFTGLIAFTYWFLEVDWDWAFEYDIEELWDGHNDNKENENAGTGNQ